MVQFEIKNVFRSLRLTNIHENMAQFKTLTLEWCFQVAVRNWSLERCFRASRQQHCLCVCKHHTSVFEKEIVKCSQLGFEERNLQLSVLQRIIGWSAGVAGLRLQFISFFTAIVARQSTKTKSKGKILGFKEGNLHIGQLAFRIRFGQLQRIITGVTGVRVRFINSFTAIGTRQSSKNELQRQDIGIRRRKLATGTGSTQDPFRSASTQG